MPKANRVPSTKRIPTPLRKTSPTVQSPLSKVRPSIDPETLPDLYCMGLDGNCLEPFGGLAELRIPGNLALDALTFGVEQFTQAFEFGNQVLDFRDRNPGDALN
jgi:hypothetical protein